MRTISIVAGVLGLVCLVSAGCGKGTSAKPMYGSVTCGGESVPMGRVSFVPMDAAAVPPCATPIIDGQYRLEERGGVPLGKYRVEVDARKKTGRKVMGHNGFEMTMIDEEVRMGPEVYVGERSPLVVDVTADFDGQFDVAIPR